MNRVSALLVVVLCGLGFGVVAGAQPTIQETASDACSSPAGPVACEGFPTAPALAVEARQISVVLWNAHELALVHRDLAAFRQLDTGTQLLADTYAVLDAKCGCSGIPYYWRKNARPLNAVTIYLPHEMGYPLFFMAQILSGAPSESDAVTAALIITRAGPDEPWRIASEMFETGYFPSAVPFPPPVPDVGGFDSDPQNPPADVAASWPAMLAGYYTYFKDHEGPPPGAQFLPGGLTTGSGLDRNPQGITRRGVTYRYQFLVAHGPWIMNSSIGTLACSDIYELVTQTPAKAHTYLLQLPDMSSMGAEVAPGAYKRLVTTYEWATCIHQTLDHLNVMGTVAGALPIRQTGVRAHP